MRTAAILPVKSFGAAKQRLGSLLGTGSRQALAQAMFQDVLASLRKVEGIEQIVVVASEPSVEFAADEQIVLLVPGDTPLLVPAELDALLANAPEQVVVIPDRHGTGTNGLLLQPPTAIEPSFGPGSLERHVAAAGAAGVTHRVERVPSLSFDVDTSDDLAVVAEAIEGSRAIAPRTRGALRQLDRAGARLKVTAGAES